MGYLFQNNIICFSNRKNENSFCFKISLTCTVRTVLLLAVLTTPATSRGFARQLWTGVDVGYSGTYTREDIFPSIFDGLSLGLHALYGFNSYVGISWEGAFDLHFKYQIYEQAEISNDSGNTTLGWAPVAKVENYYLSSTAVSFVYAIDVLRFVPFISLGLLGVRVDKKIEGVHEHGYDLGIRINLGFNYIFKKRFGLGSLFSYDQHIYRNTGHKRRMVLLIRLSLVFDFNPKSLDEGGEGDRIGP